MRSKGLKVFKYIAIALLTVLLFSFNPTFADEYAVVNIKTHRYHKVTCTKAVNCKSCIKTSLQRAKEVYEAKPCNICYKTKKAVKKHKHKKKHRKNSSKHKT